MAVNIRLSPQVDFLARAYCERVGISLNSLVGVALDAYLQRSETAPGGASVALQPEPRPPAPVAAASAAPATAKPVAPSRPVYHQPADPKPVLGPKPSKADRAKLADWYRRNPTK